MGFIKKDFISLKELTADEIMYIINTAETMKYILSQKNKKAPYLQGKSVIVIFYEKNTRTILSYELAAQYLSAGVVNMNATYDVDMGISLVELGTIIDQMGADFIILRHPKSGSAQLLSRHTSASVINAGDGFNENPSQSLLDLMTIKDLKGNIGKLRVTIVGDILHSRVSKSNIWGLLTLGADVRVAAPPTLVPPNLKDFGVKVFNDAHEAVSDADVIIASRLLPEGTYGNLLPDFNEYKRLFIIDDTMLKYAKPDAVILHPGPIKKGIEITQSVIDLKRCVVDDQIANGVAVRMAIYYLLSLKGGEGYEAVN